MSDSASLNRFQNQSGVTFIELMISIAVLGVLVAIAAPYYGDYVERQRWVGATEAIYGQFQQAKRAALSNNTQIYVNAVSTASTNWCVGYGESNACDCGTASSCQINGQDTVSVNAENYPGISLSLAASDATPTTATSISGWFSMPGISADAKTLLVESSSLGDIRLVISPVGRVRICSNDLSQYPDCL